MREASGGVGAAWEAEGDGEAGWGSGWVISFFFSPHFFFERRREAELFGRVRWAGVNGVTLEWDTSVSLLLFWVVFMRCYTCFSLFLSFFFFRPFLSATNALSCVCVYGRGLFEGGGGNRISIFV